MNDQAANLRRLVEDKNVYPEPPIPKETDEKEKITTKAYILVTST